ncbi:MAG: MerR family transcriptional regulator [Oscillospiraceae bacterium]|nr:MerR family transcriptional regulator [Oscillospiraceae bacterium]
MKTVTEVSRLTGVSVRTLHHYDSIGLLKPSRITEAGYRLYDNAALGRLQTILLLRELEFPLKQIQQILDAPNFDPVAAMEQQIKLLELKRSHLDGLIAHARQIQKTGVISMNFQPFDRSKLDRYAAEARETWGKTEAYQEFTQKTAGQTQDRQLSDAQALMDIFRRLGTLRQTDPASAEAQALIAELQAFITAHYYKCTNQILRGLGQMYTAGGEMTENIDSAGGEGTAAFAQQAIDIYCRK